MQKTREELWEEAWWQKIKREGVGGREEDQTLWECLALFTAQSCLFPRLRPPPSTTDSTRPPVVLTEDVQLSFPINLGSAASSLPEALFLLSRMLGVLLLPKARKSLLGPI